MKGHGVISKHVMTPQELQNTMATVLLVDLVAYLWSHLWLECSHDLGRCSFHPQRITCPTKQQGNFGASGVWITCMHLQSCWFAIINNLLVFLAILLRVVQAGSSDILNSTDGDRLVLSFEAVAKVPTLYFCHSLESAPRVHQKKLNCFWQHSALGACWDAFACPMWICPNCGGWGVAQSSLTRPLP